MRLSLPETVRSYLLLAMALAGLCFARVWGGYLLFHVLVEMFCVVVLSSVFVVAWNTRQRPVNGYLSFAGLGAVFIAALVLVHTLAYRGMNIIPGVNGANEATQLWIALSGLKAITLLIAPLYADRKVPPTGVVLSLSGIVILVLLSIFNWHVFPDCFVTGQGLTSFKVYAEYVICAMFVMGGVLWWRIRDRFSSYVRYTILASLIATIVAELLFTLYTTPENPFNLAGHLVEVLAYYLLYVAIVQTSLTDPFDLMLRDLQVRKQELERNVSELDAARQIAEDASCAKGRFLAVLSHELRTPLTPVLASVSDLLAQESAAGPWRETLEMIHRNVELQTRLVDDLLDLTRVERGKLRLEKRPVDVHDCIRHAMGICRGEFQGKKVGLEVDLQATSSWVMGDPARVEQVIWNLLNNARKFTDAGGWVKVRTTSSQQMIVIAVEDNGIGIDPEMQDRIFEPFEQAGESAVQAGGLGLGLAIARSMVQLHGGSISVSSVAGQGATFTVSLPTIPAPTRVCAGGVEPETEVLPRRLLLIEDHADTARVIGQLLRRDGHLVDVANTAQSARELFAEAQYDLVISDIGLPDGNGLELLRGFKSLRPGVMTICMSGYGSEQDLRASGDVGITCHLIKPVTMQRLRQAISDADALLRTA